jgi:NhaP-type Na+/H+ or K+/H+ antiporter
MGQILILAGPMLMVSTFMSAFMFRYILGYDGEFTWIHSLLFGSIISATDPVAVVALLKELGASKRLSTLIEGESLLNDGTAMVVFAVILEMAHGVEMGPVEVVGMFCRLSLGGPILGVLGGIICSYILSKIHNNAVLEVNTTIFISYLIFYVAENTAVHVSGILALVSLGLYMTKSGKTRISAESEHSVHHVWGYVGFMAENIIFILTGIIMGQRATHDNVIGGKDFALLIGTYLGLHVIRFLSIIIFWPFLKSLGYGMTFSQVLLCSYAGLRGAVGLSLALIVSNDTKLPKYCRDVILLHVGGVALLTLLINATTTSWVVKKLGLTRQSDIKKNILMSISYQLEDNA